MKIFAAGLSTETNSFAPFPTTYASFVEEGMWRGDASRSDSFVGNLVAGWRDLVLSDDHLFVEGLIATAQPAGPTTRSTFERLRDEILSQADREGPFDIVLLFLHGAMVADGYDDCEGDLLKRLRKLLGVETVIGAVLDPHCHLSSDMISYSNILILAKEYPHSDYPQRMSELYALCIQIANHEVNPSPAVFDCKMIGYYPTTTEPMSGFVRSMQQTEQLDGVLSISFVHGFELGDTPDMGSKVLVYADDNVDLAEHVATDLGTSIYQLRQKLLPSFMALDQVLADTKGADKPVIIADIGDNPGAGNASDNMNIVRALIETKTRHVVAGCFWDPIVAALCAEVGPGARLNIRLGGKAGPASGAPLDVTVTVVATKEDHTQSAFDTGKFSFGLSAWLKVDGVDIVVTSKRCQVYSQDAFTGLGIGLDGKSIITLKSGQHFYDSFARLGGTISYVIAADTVGLDLSDIPHRKLARDYFPRVPDPLGLGQLTDDHTETE